MNPTGEVNGADARGNGARFEVLGPVRVWRGDLELDVGARQQRRLLALLLARAGRPVSRSELVDLMWDADPPLSATNVIHKYVGALRRVLEPTLPPRASGSYILGHGNGYLFTAGPGTLDLAAFRVLVRSAATALAEQRQDAALAQYVDGLLLWRGAAGDGVDLGPTAVPIFVGLNNEFFDACLSATELALALGRSDRVLGPLQLAASLAPLHEPLQASLMSVLGAVGRQADALTVYRTVRMRLSEDLGIDPGEALDVARRRVLSASTPATLASALVGPEAEPIGPGPAATRRDELVGRAEEFALLRHAIEPAFAGSIGVAIIEGEPGVGKSRLLEEVAIEAARRGAVAVWGRCLEGDGAPSLWPWTRVVDALLDRSHAVRADWLSGELGQLLEPGPDLLTPAVIPASDVQFRLFERVVDLVAHVASQGPLVLLIDDLQSADVASLQLFSHVVARLPAGTAIVGALRDPAPGPGSELARALAGASREPAHRRIRLGPLGVSEVAELVRRQTGDEPDADTIRSIHDRTEGNPFFVRELARFLSDGGRLAHDAITRAAVPATVRDVIHDRVAGLDGGSNELLQIAAFIGRDFDIALLAHAAGLDVPTCLEGLEPLEQLGVLGPLPGDPFAYRFAHDIVRESVCEATPQRRATLLHLRIADALERTRGESVHERLAYHLWAAGPLADPARTAEALVRAGRRAASKAALDAAAQQLQAAARVAQRAGLAELELAALSQLAAVAGMQSMYGTSALDLLERAERLARQLGRKIEATGFLFTRWAVHAQAIQLEESGPLARRLLQQGAVAGDPLLHAYGLNAWGIHQWAIGNIREAMRCLTQAHEIVGGGLPDRERNPVGYDLGLLVIGMLAETTAMHGDVDAAWRLLDAMDAATDDAYTITVASSISARIAAIAGDPVRALRAAERGVSVDPQFSFVFLGTYQRLAGWWARAVTGTDPQGAAEEAERLIAANLLDPPRSCIATWYGLLAEMRLAAGMPEEAAAALDRAETRLAMHGQRYPEPLLGLLRARVLQAQGRSVDVVQSTADRARELAADRGSHLFAQRAEAFLAELAASTIDG